MGVVGAFFFLMGLARLGTGRGGYYHHHQHYGRSSAAGLVTGCGVACVGLVVMTSTLFAAIRRATGLTFKRKLNWPPVNVETGERWLRWYDSRLVKIHETAEKRIAQSVQRYGNDIEDPAIRQVWEQQLREDAMDKIQRIKDRRKCCADMVQLAKDKELNPHGETSRRHPPPLALYLYMGEWLLDWMVSWMRSNPHFCYEPGGPPHNLPGSVSLESLLGGSEDGPRAHPGGMADDYLGSAASSTEAAGVVPYIATARHPTPHMSPPHLLMPLPEPSAPVLSESQLLKMAVPLIDHEAPLRPGMAAARTASQQGYANASDQPLRYETLEPPPYTPINDSTSDSESEHDAERKTAQQLVPVLNKP